MSRYSLSIVVPAYNEELRLGSSLPVILDYVRQSGLDAEVVVVNDGSSDETAKIARRVLSGGAGRVVDLAENRGKGFAVRTGVLEAQGRWVLMTDADLSTPIEEHRRLADYARDHDLDAVIGSRGLSESNIEVRQNFLRETMGKTFNRIIRLGTGLPFRDTQCGFKLIDRERSLPIFRSMIVDRFAFDVEYLFLCQRYGLEVREIPVTWRNAEGSKVSVLADPLNMLWDVARIRWHFRRGRYLSGSATEGGPDG